MLDINNYGWPHSLNCPFILFDRNLSCTEGLILTKSHVLTDFLFFCAFDTIAKKPITQPKVTKIYPMFSSKSFITFSLGLYIQA